MLLCQRTHKTHSNYHLVAAELPFISKVIDCMHQTIKTYLERQHSILLSVTCTLHVCQVCHGISCCVNNGCCWTLMKHITDDIFSFRKTGRWCTCIVCVKKSNCCGALYFLSNSSELNSLVTRFRESYSSVSMSRESNKTEEIKQLVEFWKCTDTAFQWKMQFSCFPVLLGSAEAHVIWGGTVKRILVAYFIGSISAKKY